MKPSSRFLKLAKQVWEFTAETPYRAVVPKKQPQESRAMKRLILVASHCSSSKRRYMFNSDDSGRKNTGPSRSPCIALCSR